MDAKKIDQAGNVNKIKLVRPGLKNFLAFLNQFAGGNLRTGAHENPVTLYILGDEGHILMAAVAEGNGNDPHAVAVTLADFQGAIGRSFIEEDDFTCPFDGMIQDVADASRLI